MTSSYADPAALNAKLATAALRKRKRAVRLAVQTGGTVPFDLRTLIEDGHSAATIRRVVRASGAMKEMHDSHDPVSMGDKFVEDIIAEIVGERDER